jgi:phospholipid transport system substrate-binding protein
LIQGRSRSAQKPVSIDYVVRELDGEGWQVVDVYLDSRYSELAVRRSEFTSVLGRQGFDALLALIDSRVEAYRTGGR